MNQSFILGLETLILVFYSCHADFVSDSGVHNVMQVSIREYGSCSADPSLQDFQSWSCKGCSSGGGVFYFICSVANYCALGQMICVVIRHENNSPYSAPNWYARPRQLDSLQPSAMASILHRRPIRQ